MSDSYSQLAGVAAVATVYTLIFGAVYKLSDFILKLRDVEIESVRSEYQKTVITSRLNERKPDAEWLEHLTNELNLPRDLKYELEFAERYGRYCIYLAVAGVVLWGSYVSGTVAPFYLPWILLGGLFAGLIEFMVLYVYFDWLGRARSTLVDMREKISERQTSQLLTSSSSD